MSGLKIALRKEGVKRTILLRILFYSMFLALATLIFYLVNIVFPVDSFNIVYIVYSFIVLFLAFVFQYLVFSYSLNKKATFWGFKEALVGYEIDHPIKFLFPEFDFYYDLQDSIIDKENTVKLLDIAETAVGVENALILESEFKEFIKENLDDLLTYEVVIKMKRKGKAIFDDLVDEYPSLEKLTPYTDPAVIFYVNKIKGRSIIIFDDSIHYGDSAREMLNKLKIIGYKKILYLTVISQQNSLSKLESDYKKENVEFLQYKELDEKNYRQYYSDYMFGYLDHVNKSLENDHTIVKLKLNALIKKEDLLKVFSQKNYTVYEVERFVDKPNEYKISVECPRLYENMKKKSFKNIQMDMVKVRLFVRLNEPDDLYERGTTDVNLSPALIPREFPENFCKKRHYCSDIKDETDGEFKNLICINCFIRKVTEEFLVEFMNELRDSLEDSNINIIEDKTYLPYPQEIYHLEGV